MPPIALIMTNETKIQTHTFVSLTPDDILTLKLLRDFLRRETLGNWKTNEWDRSLETLERILKQVG
jgi:hypothetical protein